MKKASLLKVVNLLLFFSFLWQAITGLGHSYIPYHIYTEIHSVGGIIFVILAIIHLWLNRSWIKTILS